MLKRIVSRVCVLAFLIIGVASAQAACVRPDTSDRSLRAATVDDGGASRVYFVQGGDVAPGCPALTAVCRARAFVVPGDVVLLSSSDGDYVCASFSNARGGLTTGWLAADSVTEQAPVKPSAQSWRGHWSAPEQDIVIAVTPAGALAIKGDATWGGRDPERVRRGGVNVGDFEATVKPSGDALAFTAGDRTLPFDQGEDTDCRVRLTLRGPYLVAADNNQCGGNNVTFSGIYRRG